MRLWNLIKLVAGGGMLVVLGAAALMLWPLLWPPDPDASAQLVNGRLIGEAAGYLGRVDRDARTVDVSASLLGWRPIVIGVSDATAILVQSRQGGFGDLWKDMPVRVSYEIVGDRRLARSIEVVTGDSDQSRGVVSGAVTTTVTPPAMLPPTTRAAEPVSARPAAAPTPARPDSPTSAAKPSGPPVVEPPKVQPQKVEPLKVEPPKQVEPAVTRPSAAAVEPPRRVDPPVAKPSPAPVVEPPRRVEPAPAKPAPVTVAEPPRRTEPPPPAPAARPEPVTPSPARTTNSGESDPGDGAAAIDWLLKGGRGR